MSLQSKLGSAISSIDQFGAISQMTIFNNDPKFKTIYGGLLSLLIYSIGFTYFIYLMVMWRTFQIQPNVITQSEFNSGLQNFKLSEVLFVFSLEVDGVDKYNDEINQLQEKGDIFKYGSYVDGNPTPLQLNDPEFSCIEPKVDYDFFDPVCINLNDGNQTSLNSDAMDRTKDTYINFLIAHCDPNIDTTCLNIKDQDRIFAADSQWRLTLLTQSIELDTGKIISIPQDFFFPAYQNGTTQQYNLKITKVTYIIDTGILFSNEKEIELVDSIQLTLTQYPQIDPISKTPLIAEIIYSMMKQEKVVWVRYPKLGQILAELGSILQSLLLFGLIMNMFNDALMQAKIEETLLKIYFPQMKLFKFSYNWRGKIKSVFIKGLPLKKTELNQIKEFRNTSGKLVMSKLNYINILYELSRLQIQVQLQLPRQQLVKLQDLGYLSNSLPLDCLDELEYQEKEILCYEDFLILFQKDKHLRLNEQMTPNNQTFLKYISQLNNDFSKSPGPEITPVNNLLKNRGLIN